MQSFYRRFVRDFMRYRDVIQCAGHELVKLVRADALKEDPSQGGHYYALHIRRGDFQYKDVKLSAEEILHNLKFPNGSSIIPAGSLVYLSTDDPEGICENCLVNRQPCDSYAKGTKPPGCPEDVSILLIFD
jgi:GDP-fucose protein O-fucosyltransferase